MKQKIEIEIDIPDGYEFVRYDAPNPDDLMLIGSSVFGFFGVGHEILNDVLIVRRAKQWRDPVLPADHGKEARFSDDGQKWIAGELAGWIQHDQDDDNVWVNEHDHGYKFCQVCEETK